VRGEGDVVDALDDVAHVKGQPARRVGVLTGGAREMDEQVTE
jgi:hypothetical protein